MLDFLEGICSCVGLVGWKIEMVSFCGVPWKSIPVVFSGSFIQLILSGVSSHGFIQCFFPWFLISWFYLVVLSRGFISWFCFRYSDNQRAQDALNLTLFHWGIHGWAAYNFVGLIVAFMTYRKGAYTWSL